jgi:hypothetical protein
VDRIQIKHLREEDRNKLMTLLNKYDELMIVLLRILKNWAVIRVIPDRVKVVQEISNCHR